MNEQLFRLDTLRSDAISVSVEGHAVVVAQSEYCVDLSASEARQYAAAIVKAADAVEGHGEVASS